MKKKTSLDSSETLSSHQLYDDITNWSVVQLLMPELEGFFFLFFGNTFFCKFRPFSESDFN